MTEHAHLASFFFSPQFDAADSPCPFNIHIQRLSSKNADFSGPCKSKRQKARESGSSRVAGILSQPPGPTTSPPQGRRVCTPHRSRPPPQHKRRSEALPSRPKAKAKLLQLPNCMYLQAHRQLGRACAHRRTPSARARTLHPDAHDLSSSGGTIARRQCADVPGPPRPHCELTARSSRRENKRGIASPGCRHRGVRRTRGCLTRLSVCCTGHTELAPGTRSPCRLRPLWVTACSSRESRSHAPCGWPVRACCLVTGRFTQAPTARCSVTQPPLDFMLLPSQLLTSGDAPKAPALQPWGAWTPFTPTPPPKA